MALLFNLNASVRPSRLTESKGESYHAATARWAASALSFFGYNAYYWKCFLNENFVRGNQWYGEGMKYFFEDQAGNSRGRERVVLNIIRPYVMALLDEARKMSIDFKCYSISDGVINRREKEQARFKGGFLIAQQYPALKKYIQQAGMPVGDTMEETQEIFKNLFVDEYEEDLNNLVRYVEKKNDLKGNFLDMEARNLAVTGLAACKLDTIGGELTVRPIQSENFFFDIAAVKSDLSDSDYFGDLEYAMPTELYERYDISAKQKEAIERAVSQGLSNSVPQPFMMPMGMNYYQSRVPVINTEWRDAERMDYGFVRDEFGYEFLSRVYPATYKPKDGTKVYHYSDLISSEMPTHRAFLKGKKVRTLDIEVMHYCKITPSEYFNGGEDIVYDYGQVPFQETFAYDPTIAESSYKAIVWDYHDGWIGSPIDDLINPQERVNRANSIADSRMATAGGSGLVVSKEATLMSDIDTAEVERRSRTGETLFLKDRGLGVQNIVGRYGGDPGNGAMEMKEIANAYKADAQAITATFTPMPKTSKKVEAGAEEQQMSMHGQYLNCLVSLYKDIYNGIANKAKRVYFNSPRKLAIMIGDKGMEEIIVSEGLLKEDYRVFVERTDDSKISKLQAQEKLDALFQAHIITKDDYANAYGRVEMDELGKVIRDSVIREKEAAKKQQQMEQQQKMEQQMNINAAQERQDAKDQQQRLDDQISDAKAALSKLEQIKERTMGNIIRDKAKTENKIKEAKELSEIENKT